MSPATNQPRKLWWLALIAFHCNRLRACGPIHRCGIPERPTEPRPRPASSAVDRRPERVRNELSETEWNAFAAQCKSEFGFTPETAGVIEAARKLGTAEGAWDQAWQRFRESPVDYPGIPSRLRDGKPLELFTPSSLAVAAGQRGCRRPPEGSTTRSAGSHCFWCAR